MMKTSCCALVWALHVGLLSSLTVFAASNSDDFNDNSKNTSKWGNDVTSGGTGSLVERNQRLEYTSSSGAESDSNRPWILTRMPYNADWEVQIDTVNNTVPSPPLQVNSFGILLLSPFTADDTIAVEMYASALLGGSARNGFYSQFETDDDDEVEADSGEQPTTQGAIRMAFDSATKVISVHYDTNRNDGYQWTEFGSFGVANANGTTANRDWGLSDTNQFPIFVYGYSDAMTISSGQMYGDNFMETGGVTPDGTVSPEPVGKFTLRFPTNNPLVTRILSIFGNFQGRSVLLSNRMYNVDVAQDEAGKLMGMGSLEGVQDSAGNSQISGTFGAVKTVNNEPTALVKTGFKGTVDGNPTTLNSSGTFPLTLMDLGGGTNGLEGTATFKGKVGPVPIAAKNIPLNVPISPEAAGNSRKAWNIQLDLSRKLIKGRERTVASAQLELPNGDTIAYPERVVRYSTTKGYSLSFKRGTNVTVNPSRLDKKSSVLLKNLVFVQQGNEWEPTGGTITYQFLGQKGTANIVDFLEP